MSIRQLLRNESAEALGDMLMTGSVIAIIAIGVVLFMDPDVSGWRFAGLWIGGAVLVVSLLVVALITESVFEGRGDKKRLGPLCYAARKGKLNQVQQLLQEGADVNGKGDGGRTALEEAARNGHTGIVKVLLDNGADINGKDDIGITSLTGAASNGHTSVVIALIAQGANVNVFNKYGFTVLMDAAHHDRATIVKILLGAGADVNATADNGSTALKEAAERNHTEVVDLLKKAGDNE